MTDPRIEAAARALFEKTRAKVAEQRQVLICEYSEISEQDKNYWREDARLAVEAADGAAWRTTAVLPPFGDIVFIVSPAGTEALKAVALWDYNRKVWHNPDLGMFYSPTYFTHWQPLPARPTKSDAVGGGNG